MKFLDLSNWNNVQDYSQIKNNYLGAICKATEGTDFTDKTFESKARGLKAQGLKVGAYHFLKGNVSPNLQAMHFYNTIKHIKLDFKPVLDIETNEFNGQAYKFVKDFATQFKKLSGMEIVIYSGWYYIKDNFTPQQRKEFKWWVASYGIQSLPKLEQANFIAWQYTNSEQVAGIIGGVDCSILYSESFFNGNYKAVNIKKTPTNNNIREYDEKGTATVIVNSLNVRDNYDTNNSNVLTSYVKGESFNYNHVIITKDYVWVRYTSYSGKIRYVAVKNVITGERYANCY